MERQRFSTRTTTKRPFIFQHDVQTVTKYPQVSYEKENMFTEESMETPPINEDLTSESEKPSDIHKNSDDFTRTLNLIPVTDSSETPQRKTTTFHHISRRKSNCAIDSPQFLQHQPIDTSTPIIKPQLNKVIHGRGIHLQFQTDIMSNEVVFNSSSANIELPCNKSVSPGMNKLTNILSKQSETEDANQDSNLINISKQFSDHASMSSKLIILENKTRSSTNEVSADKSKPLRKRSREVSLLMEQNWKMSGIPIPSFDANREIEVIVPKGIRQIKHNQNSNIRDKNKEVAKTVAPKFKTGRKSKSVKSKIPCVQYVDENSSIANFDIYTTENEITQSQQASKSPISVSQSHLCLNSRNLPKTDINSSPSYKSKRGKMSKLNKYKTAVSEQYYINHNIRNKNVYLSSPSHNSSRNKQRSNVTTTAKHVLLEREKAHSPRSSQKTLKNVRHVANSDSSPSYNSRNKYIENVIDDVFTDSDEEATQMKRKAVESILSNSLKNDSKNTAAKSISNCSKNPKPSKDVESQLSNANLNNTDNAFTDGRNDSSAWIKPKQFIGSLKHLVKNQSFANKKRSVQHGKRKSQCINI